MKKEISISSAIYIVFFFLFLLIPQSNVRSSISHVDVIAHVIGFFLLYFVLHRGFGFRDFTSILFTLIVAVFTEGMQYLIPWRSCSLVDFLSDIVGMSSAFVISQKRDLLEKFIATFGFVGYVRFGPGTFAALITTLFVYWARPTVLFLLEGLVLVIFSGIAASSLLAERVKVDDPKEVVIDEVAGVLTAFLFLPRINVFNLSLAFVFFRLYDIIKPFGIRKVEKIKGGTGIMIDDMVAGIYAGISTFLVIFFLKKGGIL